MVPTGPNESSSQLGQPAQPASSQPGSQPAASQPASQQPASGCQPASQQPAASQPVPVVLPLRLELLPLKMLPVPPMVGRAASSPPAAATRPRLRSWCLGLRGSGLGGWAFRVEPLTLGALAFTPSGIYGCGSTGANAKAEMIAPPALMQQPSPCVCFAGKGCLRRRQP